MKKLIVSLLIFILIGCSNISKFDNVYKGSVAIQTAVSESVNYNKFCALSDNLSVEVNLLRNSIGDKDELLQKYIKVQELCVDTKNLWTAKINSVEMAVSSFSIYLFPDVADLAKKYKFDIKKENIYGDVEVEYVSEYYLTDLVTMVGAAVRTANEIYLRKR